MVEAAWQDLPQRRGCGCGGSWDHQPSCTASPPVPQALGQPCPALGKATAMSHPWDSCVPILGQSQPCPVPGTLCPMPGPTVLPGWRWAGAVPLEAPLPLQVLLQTGLCYSLYYRHIYIHTHTLLFKHQSGTKWNLHPTAVCSAAQEVRSSGFLSEMHLSLPALRHKGGLCS